MLSADTSTVPFIQNSLGECYICYCVHETLPKVSSCGSRVVRSGGTREGLRSCAEGERPTVGFGALHFSPVKSRNTRALSTRRTWVARREGSGTARPFSARGPRRAPEERRGEDSGSSTCRADRFVCSRAAGEYVLEAESACGKHSRGLPLGPAH